MSKRLRTCHTQFGHNKDPLDGNLTRETGMDDIHPSFASDAVVLQQLLEVAWELWYCFPEYQF